MTRLWTEGWASNSSYIWTSIALLLVWAASVPTAVEIFKKGNEADPLGKEILEEERKRQEQEKLRR